MTETAYSTDNPDAVAAYRQVHAARENWKHAIKTGLAEIGAGPKVWLAGFAGEREVSGVEAKRLPDEHLPAAPGDDEEGSEPNDVATVKRYHVPDGWQINKDGVLVPRRSKPGESARQWIAARKLPSVTRVMAEHGLPPEVWVPSSGGDYRIHAPVVFEHDGVLWATYPLAPDRCGFNPQPCTWTPRKLSEFYAAKEAVQAAETEKAGA